MTIVVVIFVVASWLFDGALWSLDGALQALDGRFEDCADMLTR
ncbi:hypothetical protein RBB78_14550 [Tunturiibacter empetritectus]